MDISILFFGAGGPGPDGDHSAGYDDILAIARAADELGFAAVWTPERHFQEVGQVFPSPAVLSAALAVATTRIAVRAGSVVLPLHHPLRVAEDWAVVDNLSRGRIGLSVAAGWHSADFVLAPGRYPDRREHALQDLALLRRLWAGECVEFPDGTGRLVGVRSQPRPYSAHLPLWLTSSGNPETWIAAGRLRTNVLAATAGQSREEIAGKIRLYREAYQAAPEVPGTGPHGTVTLMAHTYVGADDEDAVRRASPPLRDYLKSYMRQTASNHGERDGSGQLTPAEQDAVTQFALHRYLAWGGLIGSPETCRKSLLDLKELGCDEVACFIDFGLGRDEVLAGLTRLAGLLEGSGE